MSPPLSPGWLDFRLALIVTLPYIHTQLPIKQNAFPEKQNFHCYHRLKSEAVQSINIYLVTKWLLLLELVFLVIFFNLCCEIDFLKMLCCFETSRGLYVVTYKMKNIMWTWHWMVLDQSGITEKTQSKWSEYSIAMKLQNILLDFFCSKS